MGSIDQANGDANEDESPEEGCNEARRGKIEVERGQGQHGNQHFCTIAL